ncbi:hypothetical protein AB0L06_10755 [Spirillospora sp. NPDC052269]
MAAEKVAEGWRLRCRSCSTTAPITWTALLSKRTGPNCSACGADGVTAQDAVTGQAIAFPRPLVPPVEWWQCCNCGGTGLDAYGDACSHCEGLGHCT